MSATVTNEGEGITTKTSTHTASAGPPDVCWNPPMRVRVPHVNNVTTDKAVEHTSGKTLFQGGNVVCVGDAITPSDPAHGDTGGGGGVSSHTYRAEARATRGSPNVRTEGKPPARTKDPTTQNHSNTTGQIYLDMPPGRLEDNPEEFLKRCSFDTAKIKCGHQDFVTQKNIDIWRGDTITVEAKRKNAKVLNAPPECAEPPHMKWHVTRSGGVNELGVGLPEMAEDFTDDTLNLPSVWTAPLGTLVYEGSQERNLSDEAKRSYVDRKNSYAQSNAAIRGSSRVEGQDTQLAYRQVKENIEQTDRANAPGLNNLRAAARLLTNLAQFLVAWRSHQNPVRIKIDGAACVGAVSYEVHCYPNSKYTFQVPLDGIIAAGRWASRAFTFVRSFAQLANVNIEGGFKIPGNVAIGLEFQWKEQDPEKGKAPPYAIAREAELSIQGQFFEIKAELQFPLTNFLAIIPVLGAVAARAIGWAIQRLGADASIGAGFSIGVSAAIATTFKWTEADGWKWDNAAFKIPFDFKVYLYARVQLSDWVHVEGQALVTADPALALEASRSGLKLKSADFMVRIGFAGIIHVDTWFYTFHESGTWYPESWTFRVPSKDLCVLIGD